MLGFYSRSMKAESNFTESNFTKLGESNFTKLGKSNFTKLDESCFFPMVDSLGLT
jgi:hypothetical protein